MSKRSIKKWALLLTFWLTLHTASLRADLIGPYSNSVASFDVDSNGLLSDTGNHGTGTLSLSGAGTRMFWYPGKAAFRAGYASGTEWNDANVGQYSSAFGYGTLASGTDATALGCTTTASGNYSLSAGIFTTSTGLGSAALNYGTTATANGASSFGASTLASGVASAAMGAYSTASGYASTTMGHQNTASGNSSVASGFGTTASAKFASAFGNGTGAVAFSSFTIGACNTGLGVGNTTPSATTWVATDPLFEVGNGGNSYGWGNPTTTQASDALVVYKNGTATLQGALTAQGGVVVSSASVAQTDIPMFNGN